jgi:hypothetical protein
MSLRTDILGAVARNLREFGYPDCTADNVLTTKLFAMFARDQLVEFMEKHEGNQEVASTVQPMLDEIDKTVATG